MAVVQDKHALTGFPVSLDQRYVAEHLKQAAKVRGLGVERQLKPVSVHAKKRDDYFQSSHKKNSFYGEPRP